jgi:hypothetical protein
MRFGSVEHDPAFLPAAVTMPLLEWLVRIVVIADPPRTRMMGKYVAHGKSAIAVGVSLIIGC